MPKFRAIYCFKVNTFIFFELEKEYKSTNRPHRFAPPFFQVFLEASFDRYWEIHMNPEKASSMVLLILGIIVVYLSFQLGPGELRRPGPGFLTFWSGLIFCFLALLVFFRKKEDSQQGKAKTVGQLWSGRHWSKTVVVALAILAYALTFTHLGFLISTAALLIFLLRAIDPVKWKVTIAGAILATFFSFVVFDLWLQVQLPHKYLETLLFLAKKNLF